MTTLIMGIVNVTPDSFSDGGRFVDADAAVARGLLLRAQGAAILDVGGESTRPGAERVDRGVESERAVPVIRALAEAGALVSIDTMNASTALAAIDAGARIVNDVSGGRADPEMLPAISSTDAEVVLGHWRGPSADMYAQAHYGDVLRDVVLELSERASAAVSAGIAPSRILVDPGIGFAKNADHNWTLLRHLPRIVGIGPRVVVGTSRKRFLSTALEPATLEPAALEPAAYEPAVLDPGEDQPSDERRDLATAVTSALAAEAGVWAVRVHDAASTRDALRVAAAWRGDSR